MDARRAAQQQRRARDSDLADAEPIPDTAGFYRFASRTRAEHESTGQNGQIVGFGRAFYFESAHLTLQVTPVGDPVFADLDGDGSQDVASLGVASNGWAVLVWLGDGRGGIRAAAEFPADNSVQQLLHGDLDGDGLHELVTLGSDTLYVVYSRKPISASTLRTIPLNRGALCGFADSLWATLADSDNDGRAELLLADRCRLAMFTWRQAPGGALALDRQQSIPELRVLPVFGDLNNDRRVDFVVPRDPPNPQEALLIFGQNSNGSFSLRQTLEGATIGAMGIGDLTGDGRGDLVVIRADAEYSRNNRLGAYVGDAICPRGAPRHFRRDSGRR
jgi:hypothetical protein